MKNKYGDYHVVSFSSSFLQVVDYTTSKTGKHGHAKANITGIDIFDGSKHVDICPTSHNMDAPNVSREEYILADINDGDRDKNGSSACHLMPTEDGAAKGIEDREDLFIPDNEEYRPMREDFEAGKEVVVVVQKAMGKEVVMPQFRSKDLD